MVWAEKDRASSCNRSGRMRFQRVLRTSPGSKCCGNDHSIAKYSQGTPRPTPSGYPPSTHFIRTYSKSPLKNVSPNRTIPRRSYHPAAVCRASHQITLHPISVRAVSNARLRSAVPIPWPWCSGAHANLRKRATRRPSAGGESDADAGKGSIKTEMTAIGVDELGRNAP